MYGDISVSQTTVFVCLFWLATRKNARERRTWGQEEVSAVEKQLSKFMVLKRLPGKHEIEEAMRKSGGALSRRTWQQVKYYIKNHKGKL
jgi:hypothetical protein